MATINMRQQGDDVVRRWAEPIAERMVFLKDSWQTGSSDRRTCLVFQSEFWICRQAARTEILWKT